MQQRNMRWGMLPPKAEGRLANTTCFDRQKRRLMWRVQWRFEGAGHTATDECGAVWHGSPCLLPMHCKSLVHKPDICTPWGTITVSVQTMPLVDRACAEYSMLRGRCLVCRRLDETTRLADALSVHLRLLSGEAAKQQLLREYLEAGPAQLSLLLRIEHRPVRHLQ